MGWEKGIKVSCSLMHLDCFTLQSVRQSIQSVYIIFAIIHRSKCMSFEAKNKTKRKIEQKQCYYVTAIRYWRRCIQPWLSTNLYISPFHRLRSTTVFSFVQRSIFIWLIHTMIRLQYLSCFLFHFIFAERKTQVRIHFTM